MATAKKILSNTPKATPAAKKPAPAAETAGPPKPIETAFSKSGLTAHLAEQAGLEPMAAKAFMAALESAILASVHKKGLRAFTLPGLMKVTATQVPATKTRVGIDPFTKVERTFAAKKATIRVKVRALKKLKDAALRHPSRPDAGEASRGCRATGSAAGRATSPPNRPTRALSAQTSEQAQAASQRRQKQAGGQRSWRWAKVAGGLIVIGLVMKLLMR